MGRYGVGHGALAIRRERNRRHDRRSSVAGDRVHHHHYTRTDNYLHFYNRHQHRKSSVGSSQSAPVKSSSDGGAAGEPDGRSVVMPGQVPPSPLSQRSGPARASRDWWPGPPLRQGGVVRQQQQDEEGAGEQEEEGEGNEKNGFLSDIVGLFSGMDTWNRLHTRLRSKGRGVAEPEPEANGDAGTTKANLQVSFADEVGMRGWPRSAPSTGSKRFLVYSPPPRTYILERRASVPTHCTGCSSGTPPSHVPKIQPLYLSL